MSKTDIIGKVIPKLYRKLYSTDSEEIEKEISSVDGNIHTTFSKNNTGPFLYPKSTSPLLSKWQQVRGMGFASAVLTCIVTDGLIGFIVELKILIEMFAFTNFFVLIFGKYTLFLMQDK